MSHWEPDEYDEYFTPLILNNQDLEALQAAEAKTLSPHRPTQVTLSKKPQNVPRAPPSPDEFDAYDLSEFSAEDLAQIDKLVHAVYTSQLPPIREVLDGSESSRSGSPLDRGSPARGGGGVRNGGPRIEIALESDKEANPRRPLKDSWINYVKRSPYQQFRSWNDVLSVTDIASPSWCEFQFDYGLRQKRSKKLGDRPASFKTAEGKTITVVQQVAAANNRTVTRGRSVHKVLEREIQPEAVQIEIKTNEERWALRLVNMLTALQTIMGLGRCREMPVFGLINDQIVTGIIDEVVRQPLPAAPSEEPEVGTTSRSPNKRPAPETAPSSPAKPSSKKVCPGSSADQSQITTLFSASTSQDATTGMAIDVDSEEPLTPDRSETALPDANGSASSPHALHLSDTKTRMRPTLPPDEDTFGSRVQLMLYHRLLSSLLSVAQSDIPSSQPLDFDALWRKALVDPTRRFSHSFLLQAGLSIPETTTHEDAPTESAINLSGLRCLNDLTQAWCHAVEALNVVGVDRTLTLVYRAQPTSVRPSAAEAESRDEETAFPKSAASASPLTSSSEPSLSLSDQEARDIAAAVQASISDVQPDWDGDDDLARAIFESLQESILSGSARVGDPGILRHPFGPPISDAGMGTGAVWTREGESAAGPSIRTTEEYLVDDPQLAWALQQAFFAQLEETPALKEAISDEGAASGIRDEDTNAEDGDGHGVVLGKLSQRAATEEPEGTGAAPPADVDEDEEMITAADLETKARILGKKEFELDDVMLDEYVASILAWWYGKRPPQGVDVELTRRCMTCEYRDGCEWREKKALEALQKYHHGTGSPSADAASE